MRQAMLRGVAAIVTNILARGLGGNSNFIACSSKYVTGVQFLPYLHPMQCVAEVLCLGWEYLLLAKLSKHLLTKTTTGAESGMETGGHSSFSSAAHSVIFMDSLTRPWFLASGAVPSWLVELVCTAPQVFLNEEHSRQAIQGTTLRHAQQRANIQALRAVQMMNVGVELEAKLSGKNPKPWGAVLGGFLVSACESWASLQLSATMVHLLPLDPFRDSAWK